MSDITVGSVWVNRCDGVEAIVVSVDGNCVGLSQVIGGKKYLYNHTVEEFKEYYSPLVKAEMVNQPKHYNDESGVRCCDVTDFMMFNGGNCFKYLYRCGSKFDDIEDLKKAKWYAGRASELGEKVVIEARNKIKEVMRYRELGIYNSMRAIRFNNWMLAVEWIEAEIARLESEAADD